MVVLRPPVYDSPTTRGLLDTSSGVYWAVDCFATTVRGGGGARSFPSNVADLDDELWTYGMTMFAHDARAPWLRLVDPERIAAEVKRYSGNPISTIVSAHSPAMAGPMITEAVTKLAGLPGAERPTAPDQAALDVLLAASQTPQQGAPMSAFPGVGTRAERTSRPGPVAVWRSFEQRRMAPHHGDRVDAALEEGTHPAAARQGLTTYGRRR